MERRRKRDKPARGRPYYSLDLVKALVGAKRLTIRPNAQQRALDDFGWKPPDIVDALEKLKAKHFYKSAPSVHHPNRMIDFYRARGLKGEDVYLHFYINERGELVVNSFKQDLDVL